MEGEIARNNQRWEREVDKLKDDKRTLESRLESSQKEEEDAYRKHKKEKKEFVEKLEVERERRERMEKLKNQLDNEKEMHAKELDNE